jgi:hypothetical protein
VHTLNATAPVTILVPPTSQAPDLNTLAAAVRDAHSAVEAAARNVFEHAVKAGTALLAAKERLRHGDWLPWVERSCEIEKRTAQRYMQIAGARDELTANASRATHLSLRGLLKLTAAAKKPARAKKAPARKAPKQATSFDALFWWSTAAPAARRHFLEGVGERALQEATPPSWRRGDIGVASTGELARLTARNAELEREIRQRDLTIAALQRQLGKPVEDGFETPPFLQRQIA